MLGKAQEGKNDVPVALVEVRNLVVTKVVLEDLGFPDVFLARDLMVLVQSTSSGISNDPLIAAYNLVVLSNFRFKVHHLVSVGVQAPRASGIEVEKVPELLLVNEVVFYVQTYRVVT